jgi:hypothetical protein
MEVLKRSGSSKEKKYAAVIAPLISNAHYLLVGGSSCLTALSSTAKQLLCGRAG